MKKYHRTAIMAMLMAGVVASVMTGSGHLDAAATILLALLAVTSTSGADYWRARCRHAESGETRDGA